jgi:hypothetical protein
MQTNYRAKVVRDGNRISIMGSEFKICIFRATGKDGKTIYGVKTQKCIFLSEKNEIQYLDLFSTPAWLNPYDLRLLIAYLLELADPPGLQAIINHMKEKQET